MAISSSSSMDANVPLKYKLHIFEADKYDETFTALF